MNARKCPYCESLVEERTAFCMFCGKEIGPASPPTPSPAPTSGGAGIRYCVACGRPIQFDAGVCPYCGHDYRIAYGTPPQPSKSWMPVVGGVLIIVAGVLAAAMGAFYFTFEASDFEDLGVALPPEFTAEDLAGILAVCGAVLVVFAVIAIIGGFFGFRRRHFGLAIAGGVFGLLGIGFFVGSLLALVGLILVAISRKEFE